MANKKITDLPAATPIYSYDLIPLEHDPPSATPQTQKISLSQLGYVLPGALTASATPSSPLDGKLWWDPNSGTLYVWYSDGDSAQWVEVGVAGPTGAGVVTGGTAGQVLSKIDATNYNTQWTDRNQWTLVTNESGNSFANWTASGGTWASNGTVIQQTDTGAAWRYAYLTTHVPLIQPFLHEVELRVPTSPGASDLYLGFWYKNLSVANVGQNIRVHRNSGTTWDVQALDAGGSGFDTYSIAGNPINTWMKLRVLHYGGGQTYWLDGTLLGSVVGGSLGGLDYISLSSYGCAADFRNFKIWNPNLTLPA